MPEMYALDHTDPLGAWGLTKQGHRAYVHAVLECLASLVGEEGKLE